MPLCGNLAKNAATDARYGDHHADTQPDTWRIRLYDDDPENGGTELPADGGYTAQLVDNTSAVWPDSDAGVKTAEIGFGTSTDAYGADASWVGIHHPTTGRLWEKLVFATPLSVVDAGTTVSVTITIFY